MFLPGILPEGESKTALNWRGVSSRFSRAKSRLTTCSEVFRLPGAYDLWRGDATVPRGRSW